MPGPTYNRYNTNGYHGKRRYTRKNNNSGFTAKQKAYINRKAHQVVDSKTEVKHIDIGIPNTSISATNGLIVKLSNVSQGTSGLTRIGIDIEPVALNYRWEFITGVGDSTNLCRMTVIQWFDRDNVAPTLGEIYQDITNERPLSAFDFVNLGTRFRVLSDAFWALNEVNRVNVSGHIKLWGRKMPKKMTYDDAASTGTDQLYVILWSDSGAVAHPTFKLHGRFSWRDG